MKLRSFSYLLCLAGVSLCFVTTGTRIVSLSESVCDEIIGGAPPKKCYRDNPYTCPSMDECPNICPEEGCPQHGFYSIWSTLSEVEEKYFGYRLEKKKEYDPDDLVGMLVGRMFYCYEKWTCKRTPFIVADICEKDAYVSDFDGRAFQCTDILSDECPG